jgi:hypothetical protein
MRQLAAHQCHPRHINARGGSEDLLCGRPVKVGDCPRAAIKYRSVGRDDRIVKTPIRERSAGQAGLATQHATQHARLEATMAS